MKQQRLKLKPKAERPRTLSVQERWDADNQYAALLYERQNLGGTFTEFSKAIFARLGRPPWENDI